jgi:hypothetical protein
MSEVNEVMYDEHDSRSPWYPWVGGWVHPRAGLDDVEELKYLTLPGLDLQPVDHEARGHSICREQKGLNTTVLDNGSQMAMKFSALRAGHAFSVPQEYSWYSFLLKAE